MHFSLGHRLGGGKITVNPNTPVCTVQPVVSGSLTQGSVLSVTTGTWTNSPTGYTYALYKVGSGTVVSTANSYTLLSGDVGASFYWVVTGTNIVPLSGTAASNTVGPVTGSGLNAPVLSRVSASGASPLVLGLDWTAPGTDTLIGYYVQLLIDNNSNFLSPEQNIIFPLDAGNLMLGASNIGLITPSGLWNGEARILRENDLGSTTATGFDIHGGALSFPCDASGFSTAISDTITASVTAFPTGSPSVNRNSFITASGTPALTVTGTVNLNQAGGIRADHVPAAAIAWVDINFVSITAGTKNQFAFSIEDGTTDLSSSTVNEPGYGTTVGVTYRFTGAAGTTQSVQHWTGTGFTGGDFVAPAIGLFQATDIFRVWIDTTNHLGRIYRNRSGGGFVQQGSDFTLPTLGSYHFTVTVFDGQQFTCDFTGWA